MQLLESVRHRNFLFHQHSRPFHSDAGPSGHMCNTPLSADQEVALSHVDEHLGEESGSSGDETYEEYTWCNVTRVRASSMLTAEARASECWRDQYS